MRFQNVLSPKCFWNAHSWLPFQMPNQNCSEEQLQFLIKFPQKVPMNIKLLKQRPIYPTQEKGGGRTSKYMQDVTHSLRASQIGSSLPLALWNPLSWLLLKVPTPYFFFYIKSILLIFLNKLISLHVLWKQILYYIDVKQWVWSLSYLS